MTPGPSAGWGSAVKTPPVTAAPRNAPTTTWERVWQPSRTRAQPTGSKRANDDRKVIAEQGGRVESSAAMEGYIQQGNPGHGGAGRVFASCSTVRALARAPLGASSLTGCFFRRTPAVSGALVIAISTLRDHVYNSRGREAPRSPPRSAASPSPPGRTHQPRLCALWRYAGEAAGSRRDTSTARVMTNVSSSWRAPGDGCCREGDASAREAISGRYGAEAGVPGDGVRPSPRASTGPTRACPRPLGNR